MLGVEKRAIIVSMKDSYVVKVYDKVLRYPPLVSQRVKEIVYCGENLEVKILNPLVRVRPWKLFLYCLWAKNSEKTLESGDVVLTISGLSALYAGNDTLTDMRKDLEELVTLAYSIRIGSKVKIFGVMKDVEYDLNGEDYLLLHIPKTFYELCEEEGLRLYIPFLLELTGKNELALFTFLSTRVWKEEVEDGNERVQKFKVETLVEKAGINTQDHISKKAWILSKALKNLTELGFLSSFRKENGFFILERPSKEELKIKAIQLKRQRDEKIKRLLERKKEAVRRYRQKKRNQAFENFPF